jgi:hypothetical protein
LSLYIARAASDASRVAATTAILRGRAMSDAGGDPKIGVGAAAPAPSAVRFAVRVQEPDRGVWPVVVEPDLDGVAWELLAGPLRQRAMRRLLHEDGWSFPAGVPHRPDEAHLQVADGDALPAIRAAYLAIVERQSPAIEAFGHYLFDALLGEELWEAMTQFAESRGADLLELALAFPVGSADLHRLPWEMMCGRSGWVAAGVWDNTIRKLSVGITRLVLGQDRVLPDPSPIPRILFVVGTALTDEKIRPGAELLGLIRRIEGDRPVRLRLLERATLRTLGETVDAFKPDVVHFICHGRILRNGMPVLELRTDERDEDAEKTADQLRDRCGSSDGPAADDRRPERLLHLWAGRTRGVPAGYWRNGRPDGGNLRAGRRTDCDRHVRPSE